MRNPVIDSTKYIDEIAVLDGAIEKHFPDSECDEIRSIEFKSGILDLLQNRSESISLFDEDTELKKIEEIIRAYRKISKLTNSLHPSACSAFMESVRANLAKSLIRENGPIPDKEVAAFMSRYDIPLMHLIPSVIGADDHFGVKLEAADKNIELMSKYFGKPGISGDKHVKAFIMHYCREFWSENKSKPAPSWLNGTNSGFEEFLRSVLSIFPKYKNANLSNVSKAYNELFG